MTATSLLHKIIYTCILRNYVGLNQARPNLVKKVGHAYDELRHYRVVNRVHSCHNSNWALFISSASKWAWQRRLGYTLTHRGSHLLPVHKVS